MDDDGLVKVFEGRVGRDAPAEVVESVLEAAGIKTVIKKESVWPAASLGFANIHPLYRVFVRSNDAEAAVELLQAQSDDEEDLDEDEESSYPGMRRADKPTNPPVVIGGLAAALFCLGIADAIFGWGAAWLLLALGGLALVVALRSRDSDDSP